MVLSNREQNRIIYFDGIKTALESDHMIPTRDLLILQPIQSGLDTAFGYSGWKNGGIETSSQSDSRNTLRRLS